METQLLTILVFVIGFEKKFWALRFELFPPYSSDSQSKNIVEQSKEKILNPPSLLNQCCESREREKIKNCTCFDNQQHWLRGEEKGICPTTFLTDYSSKFLLTSKGIALPKKNRCYRYKERNFEYYQKFPLRAVDKKQDNNCHLIMYYRKLGNNLQWKLWDKVMLGICSKNY